MTNGQTITAACHVCGKEINAPTKAQFNRTYGLHMHAAHNHTGTKTDWHEITKPNANKPVEDHPVPSTDAKTLARREYQRKWWANYRKQKAKRVEESTQPSKGTTNAVPIALEYCPCCKARFYATKGE